MKKELSMFKLVDFTGELTSYAVWSFECNNCIQREKFECNFECSNTNIENFKKSLRKEKRLKIA